MKVTPLSNEGEFWPLTPGHEYVVIVMSDQSYRLVNDQGEPTLFSKSGFRVTDNSLPGDWVWQDYGDGEYQAGPRQLLAAGFFEDYHDGASDVVQRFREYLRDANLLAEIRS